MTETVAEITTKSRERALMVPQYPTYEEIKKVRYHDMRRDDIMEFVCFPECKTQNHMISRGREHEIYLEHL